MDLAWVRDIRDQCRSAGVPLFVKQLEIAGKVVTDARLFPPDLQIQDFPITM
jgi:protein gp37